MAVQLLPKRRALVNPTLVHLFSSSSSADSGDKNDRQGSAINNFLKDVKLSLKSQSRPQPSSPLKLQGTSNSDTPSPPPPSQKVTSLEEIRNTLSSFQNPSSTTTPTPKYGFNRNSVRGNLIPQKPVSNIRNIIFPNNGSGDRGKSPAAAGLAEDLPSLVFGRELNEMSKEANSVEARMGLARSYGHETLGVKLKELRPEKRDKTWFSMEELSLRLIKLREIDQKEVNVKGMNKSHFGFLKENLKFMNEEKKPNSKGTIFSLLGETNTEYMNLPPKDHLLEIYNHPDNMSASEKMKIELAKVRDEFKMSESDCGSTRVQVALLTTKIKYLSSVLHKKDKHSRKGLVQMVNKRKSLLKYLRRTDWESYCFVLDKLGLRDVSNYKARA